MNTVSGYLLQLVSAAIVTGIVSRLLPGNGTAAMMTKLLCSIFLVSCAVSAMPQLEWADLGGVGENLRMEADAAVSHGEKAARDAMADSIIEQTEAYILEKAKDMNVDLVVQVEVSEDDIPMPASVCLNGKISPYTKTKLSNMIEQELGIDKEKQIWK